MNILTIDESLDHLTEAKIRLVFAILEKEKLEKLETEVMEDPEFVEYVDASGPRTWGMIARRIDSELDKARVRRFAKNTMVKITVAAASCVLALSLGVTVALAVNQTFRVRVVELIMNMNPQYTELALQEKIDASFEVPSEWVASKYLRYIPEGYELVEVFGTENNSNAVYRNAEGKRIVFTENDERGIISIDTENAKVGVRVLGGTQVSTIEKESISALVWQDYNHYYTIMVDGDIEMAISIMEGLTRLR